MTDLPGRLLGTTLRLLPAGHRDWGTAMQAELTAVEGRRDRWSFARGCLRTLATQFHLLRAAVHLAVVLVTLGTVFVWAATMDYRPLAWPLDVVVSALAAVCWQARRSAMLGPVGDGTMARLLRAGGYLLAGAIAALGLLHAHPGTAAEAEAGIGPLVAGVSVACYVLGLVLVCARQSAATTRTLLTASGCGVIAALTWLLAVAVAPPIPPSTGWALAVTAIASLAALAVNSGTTGRALLAALLAGSIALALIFFAVGLLASFGPDAVIPAITPHALPPDRVAESRIEIVDPYMLVLVLGALAAAALSVAAVTTRRRSTPTSGHRATLPARPAVARA
jgi:hypothetical protein